MILSQLILIVNYQNIIEFPQEVKNITKEIQTKIKDAKIILPSQIGFITISEVKMIHPFQTVINPESININFNINNNLDFMEYNKIIPELIEFLKGILNILKISTLVRVGLVVVGRKEIEYMNKLKNNIKEKIFLEEDEFFSMRTFKFITPPKDLLYNTMVIQNFIIDYPIPPSLTEVPKYVNFVIDIATRPYSRGICETKNIESVFMYMQQQVKDVYKRKEFLFAINE